jgi:cation diffusion facilitator family transporter
MIGTLHAVSVQLIALLTNIGLALLKFIVGAMSGSRALIADAFNSAGDVIATFVAWLAFRYGLKPPDEDHHYGHQNAEALAGLLLGGMLCATGLFICIDGLLGVVDKRTLEAPDQIAIWAAAITAIVKFVLYHASMRVGRRTNSPTLLASARDHRADVVSGLVALVGIVIARQGYPEFDAIAGIVIGVYIFFLSFEPLRSNTGILMHAAPPEFADQAQTIAMSVNGIRAVNQVRVQPLGGLYRMDMSVAVDGSLSVEAAHTLAHAVEDEIRAKMKAITEVHVHVEPVSIRIR